MSTPIRLFADQRGVWREWIAPASAWVDGIEWDDVFFVVASPKTDRDGLGVAFGFTVPMIFGIWEDDPGFDEVMTAVAERLSLVDPRWRDLVAGLPMGEQLVIRQRPEPAAAPEATDG